MKKTIFHVLFILSGLSRWHYLLCQHINVKKQKQQQQLSLQKQQRSCFELHFMGDVLRDNIQPMGKQYFHQCRLFLCATVLWVLVQKKTAALGRRQRIHRSQKCWCCTIYQGSGRGHFLDKLPVCLNTQKCNSTCCVCLCVKCNMCPEHERGTDNSLCSCDSVLRKHKRKIGCSAHFEWESSWSRAVFTWLVPHYDHQVIQTQNQVENQPNFAFKQWLKLLYILKSHFGTYLFD